MLTPGTLCCFRSACTTAASETRPDGDVCAARRYATTAPTRSAVAAATKDLFMFRPSSMIFSVRSTCREDDDDAIRPRASSMAGTPEWRQRDISDGRGALAASSGRRLLALPRDEGGHFLSETDEAPIDEAADWTSSHGHCHLSRLRLSARACGLDTLPFDRWLGE